MSDMKLKKKKPKGKICRPRSVSFSPEIWDLADQRAEDLKMNTSEYLRHLIRQDAKIFDS